MLRWPGGCFADEYHWKDGIGPREKRPSMINTHWGGVVEDNSFGTHEFMDLVEQLGADAYITRQRGQRHPAGDDGVGRVHDLRRRLADGQPAAPERPREAVAAAVLRRRQRAAGAAAATCAPSTTPTSTGRYNTFVKNYDRAKPIYRIASGANAEDYNWTEVLMSVAGRRMDGLSLHYYTLPTGNWRRKGSATDFGEDQWFATLQKTLRMDELITRHAAIMDKAEAEMGSGPANRPGADKKVGLVVDEWGTWYDAEPGTEARLPLPAEHAARRARRGAQLPHLPAARRPRRRWPTSRRR